MNNPFIKQLSIPYQRGAHAPFSLEAKMALKVCLKHSFDQSSPIIIFIVFCFFSCLGIANEQPQPGKTKTQAAIASAHPLATEAGYRILKEGGNAFDAAVAVAASLAVVEPYSSGLGGGGFFLLHRARDRHEVMLDARETAPQNIKEDDYLDELGRPRLGATREGGTAVGIPGLAAGLVELSQKFGRLPLKETLRPAIKLAREGFLVDNRYAKMAQFSQAHLKKNNHTAAIFWAEGQASKPGWRLKQPQLALTLERLANQGFNGFYTGVVAQALINTVNQNGGRWQASDLENYKVIARIPLHIQFHGARITTAPLPSAGGIALSQALHLLEPFSLKGAKDEISAHLIIEALRRAFRDRSQLGDPDQQPPPPVQALLEASYLKGLGESISAEKATPSHELAALPVSKNDAYNTTHFSIIDSAGNRVGATMSINFTFGSGLVAQDTGVLLNNEIDDFTLRPEFANGYQLKGGLANAPLPGRRPLSSMTPTFVDDSRGVLILGAPGGSRIVSMVLLAIIEHLAHPEVNLLNVVSMPRYHHQFSPDKVEVEPTGFSPEWLAALRAKAHDIKTNSRQWGNMQMVFKAHSDGTAQAQSDPRGQDMGWY